MYTNQNVKQWRSKTVDKVPVLLSCLLVFHMHFAFFNNNSSRYRYVVIVVLIKTQE